ncbi:uncharacterized protein LTR77_001336 [Saxophila tyrrhenica]|uniref:DnaJ homologue subfamily C member 28 conserved domain-containing protein n=1 Tax=Saxophila tyrrhenica TaxID=1690608 RepID=A0AAV9PKI3_9PEZI|nr:hypothetical protein LTR77_001336 [Saxophila tyrrhenica]
MSEESIETGGRSARKAVEEAGFSEELRRQLEDKIANASFRSDNAQAFAQANLPASAGRGMRDIAAARPWTGQESTEDASLRMLTDAHKPLRSPARIPGVRGPPSKIDTGRPSGKPQAGVRLANARDRTSMYEYAKDSGLSEEEREKLRQEMKMRFAPSGRSAPATVQGLASLANQRIDDAIASGKFKNLPRGQKIEKDHNANSPFIDTTSYLLNKIIQRQEILPPWVEKQQELVSTATKFRSRLRADWKRHAARVISSGGGGLDKQMQLAEEYALAESVYNPTKKKEETLNAVDNTGHLSQISVSGELKASDPDPTMSVQDEETHVENEIKIMEQSFNDDGSLKAQPDSTVKVSVEQPEQHAGAAKSAPSPPRQPTVPLFRDPNWEKTEHGYLNAAINNLNNLARTYNLMAPPIARKPYYYLDRELKACYADVAPQLALAIKERALAPKVKGVEIVGHRPGGVLDKFSMDHKATVYDDRRPEYGFKQFWKDLFAKT